MFESKLEDAWPGYDLGAAPAATTIATVAPMSITRQRNANAHANTHTHTHTHAQSLMHSSSSQLPQAHDVRPTMPEDLADYAWRHTGPDSVEPELEIDFRITERRTMMEPAMMRASAAASAPALEIEELDASEFSFADLSEEERWFEEQPTPPLPDVLFRPSALDSMTTDLLVDLWHSDVPQIVSSVTTIMDDREARLLSLLDGEMTVGTILETSGLPVADILDMLCDLGARGVVSLDRSRRIHTVR